MRTNKKEELANIYFICFVIHINKSFMIHILTSAVVRLNYYDVVGEFIARRQETIIKTAMSAHTVKSVSYSS